MKQQSVIQVDTATQQSVALTFTAQTEDGFNLPCDTRHSKTGVTFSSLQRKRVKAETSLKKRAMLHTTVLLCTQNSKKTCQTLTLQIYAYMSLLNRLLLSDFNLEWLWIHTKSINANFITTQLILCHSRSSPVVPANATSCHWPVVKTSLLAPVQAWITQVYPQTTPCLPLPRKRHQKALTLIVVIAAYYSFIDPERMKGWVGLVGWPTADGSPM